MAVIASAGGAGGLGLAARMTRSPWLDFLLRRLLSLVVILGCWRKAAVGRKLWPD